MTIEGLVHDGAGELEGSSAPRGHPLRGAVQHRRLLVGLRDALRRGRPEAHGRAGPRRRGELAGGMLHGLHYDQESGGFALSFCTATDPTQLYVLEPTATRQPARRTRERVLGLAPELLSRGRGRVLRVARRPARVRASLSPVSRARLRRAAPARLLRARRPAGPGAPELRVVLDAAHPDPDARGIRRLRPERARLDRATGSTTRSGSTGTGEDSTGSTTCTR